MAASSKRVKTVTSLPRRLRETNMRQQSALWVGLMESCRLGMLEIKRTLSQTPLGTRKAPEMGSKEFCSVRDSAAVYWLK